MLETFHEVTGSIRRNKMRTAATGFAVASGLFLIIMLQGAGNGVIHSFEANSGTMSFDAVHVFGGMTTMPFEGIKDGRFIRLDDRDLDMTRRRFPLRVSEAMPTQNADGMVASHGKGHIEGSRLVGVQPGYARAMSVRLREGRFVNAIDIREKRKVAVVGDGSAKTLFGTGGRAVGRVLNVSGVPYTVVGVYKTDDMSDTRDFYVPYSTLTTIYHRGRGIDQMTMTIRDIPTKEAMDTFIADYTRASSHIHSFHPEDRRALWIWNQAESNITMSRTKAILRSSFWALGLLTLVSGVVGVSNIMLISVKERTREFGVRRALGARPWSIIRMVMLESVTITSLFGYAGMLLGVLFCEWMDAAVAGRTVDIGFAQFRYFVDPTVDIGTCAWATVVIVAAGALAGFFPARRAVRVKPIDALRS